MAFLRIASYLPLTNSIFWACLYTNFCFGVLDGSISGQGPVVLMAPFFLGAPINIICLLVLILWVIFFTRKRMKKWSQVLVCEFRLVWAAILLLNIYMFQFVSAGLCLSR